MGKKNVKRNVNQDTTKTFVEMPVVYPLKRLAIILEIK